MRLRRGFGAELSRPSDFNFHPGHVVDRSTGAGLWPGDEVGLPENPPGPDAAFKAPTFHGSWRGIADYVKWCVVEVLQARNEAPKRVIAGSEVLAGQRPQPHIQPQIACL